MHMPEANRLEQVADVVREVIRRVRPANVDEAATTRTGEGPDVSIILVPHRALGGLALGLWADAKGVRLFWADVGDLSYTTTSTSESPLGSFHGKTIGRSN
jgi:hypothetical protein